MENRSSLQNDNEGSLDDVERSLSFVSDVPAKLPNRGGWIVLRFIISAILFFAAFMKARQLVALPSLGDGWLDSRFVNASAVAFEFAFVLWLLAGFRPKTTRFVVIVLFVFFACVSLFKALSGARTCGCFGALVVNPWLTFSLDSTIVLSSIAFKPRWESSESRSLLVKVSAFCLFVAIASFLFLTCSAPQKFILLQSADQKLTSDATIILEPDTWVGQVCPVLPFCNLQEELSNGRWLIMLYRPDCENCHKAFPECKRRADESGVPLAVLNVEPNKEDEPFEGVLCGRLDPAFNWFVETPCLLEINNLIVN